MRFVFLHVIGSFKKTISTVMTRHLDNTMFDYVINSDDSITARGGRFVFGVKGQKFHSNLSAGLKEHKFCTPPSYSDFRKERL